MTPNVTPAAVREDLERAITRFARTSDRTFEGEVLPGPALVGPKERVHGGLHPMLRVFLPLARLDVPQTRAVHLELPLRASLPLGVTTPFAGELEVDGESLTLRTRFGTAGKLDAEATTRLGDADLARFVDEHRACLRAPERKTILARGSVPTRVGEQTVSLTMDPRFFEAERNEMNAYRTRDGGFDEAFAGVALDLVGAVTVGFQHVTHVFTTHLSLDFHVRSVPRGTPLVAIASVTRATPDAEIDIKPVEVRGVMVPATRVPVLLVDADLRTPIVSGHVTVVPVRNGLAVPSAPR